MKSDTQKGRSRLVILADGISTGTTSEVHATRHLHRSPLWLPGVWLVCFTQVYLFGASGQGRPWLLLFGPWLFWRRNGRVLFPFCPHCRSRRITPEFQTNILAPHACILNLSLHARCSTSGITPCPVCRTAKKNAWHVVVDAHKESYRWPYSRAQRGIFRN